MNARILVVEHEDNAGPGWLGEWWVERGLVLDIRRGHRGDPVPGSAAALRAEGASGLLVMGGSMGAASDDTHPWLTPTKALIRDAVAGGIPFLGVCLGHQLATLALGGTVGRNPSGRTRGLVEVRLTDAGRGDPVIGHADGRLALHYNDDVASALPPGSTALAHAPDGTVQAVRFAPLAWGVQLHPEVSPEVFVDVWGAQDPLAPATAAAVRAAGPGLRATWRELAAAFAHVVTS